MQADSVLFRLLLIFAFALLFGLQRQRSHKPVGFGTFIFVATGSCALALAAQIIDPNNPIPLLGAIVTGVGFLGAGALIRTSDKIFGFTTAASIWLFSIIGLLIGLGNYLIASTVYIVVWTVIGIDKRLETKGVGSYNLKLKVTTNKIISESLIKDELLIHVDKHRLISMHINKQHSSMEIDYIIEASRKKINALANNLYKKEWCSAIKVE